VTIHYIKQKRENVLIVSRSYINTMSGRYYVNVLEDGVRVERDIEIGLMTATEVEIVDGIDEDDLIIIN
jgi:membrane fusion protein, macrolide-specific efflux system